MNIISTMRPVGDDSNESNLSVQERSAREKANATYKLAPYNGNYERALDGARKYNANQLQENRGIFSAIAYAESKSNITGLERVKLGADSFLGRKFDYFKSEYMVKNTNSADAVDRWNVENLYEWALDGEAFKAARAESSAKRAAQYKIDFDASVKRIEQERRDKANAQVRANEANNVRLEAQRVEREAQMLSSMRAATAQPISNPAAAALQTSVAGTDTKVVPTTVTLPPSSSTSTPSTGTSPLTIAAIGLGVLKLLAII